MANTDPKHKEKKSQKRKDRQLRRKQKQEEKQASAKKDCFMIQSMKTMKGTSKSLPGFLAKNINLICDWLKEYCKLFQKADDACISYLKDMERTQRDKLVQDYVDIHVFVELVEELKRRNTSQQQEIEILSTEENSLSCENAQT